MSIKDKVENFGKVGENIAIFKKAMKTIDSSDTLKESVNKSIESGYIFTPDDWIEELPKAQYETRLDVTQEGSFEAAKRIREADPDAKIAVLNFASAKHPGGMVTKGSSAQEESLCRVSTLYKVISNEKFMPYYDKYEEMKDSGKMKHMYSDMAIYSHDVKVILDLETKEVLEEDKIWNVDVITSAFPNLRHLKEKEIDYDKLKDIYDRRIENVFQLALHEGVENLILGAWGCGVFKNDPSQVAESYLRIQKKYDGLFKTIIHPVFCKKGEEENFTTFFKVLTGDDYVEMSEEDIIND